MKSGAGYLKKAQYLVKIASPGYADQTAPIKFNLNSWYFGNILIGGVIGLLTVDPLMGAMYKLKTPTVNLTLNKSTVSETPAQKILNVNDLTPEMRKQLVRIN